MEKEEEPRQTAAIAPYALPSGVQGAFEYIGVALGQGTAYSNTVRPILDPILRASGLSATLDTTSGSESWTYEPQSDPNEMSSGTFYLYERQQLFKCLGSYFESLFFEFEGPTIPIFFRFWQMSY